MPTESPVKRLPWRRIAIALSIATVTAWAVGFAAGLIVRWFFGIE